VAHWVFFNAIVKHYVFYWIYDKMGGWEAACHLAAKFLWFMFILFNEF